MKNLFAFAVAASMVACGPLDPAESERAAAGGSVDSNSAVEAAPSMALAWTVSVAPTLQETTPTRYVTWGTAGGSVGLSAPAITASTVTVTATANVDVGATPYYIQIFDANGTRIAVCGTGSSCSTQFQPSASGSQLVAFISSFSTALPPPNVQASSNIVTTSLLLPPK